MIPRILRRRNPVLSSHIQPISGLRPLASKRRDADINEADLDAARKWLKDLNPETIPRNICDVSFSRASGPGGQNVNKVSSKATVRVPTSSLLRHVPALLHPSILGSRYVAAKSSDLVIQADESRKQAENVNACFQKLYKLIVQAGKEVVPSETSIAQAERVKGLQKAEAAQRRKMKEFQSTKKSARRARSGSE